MEKDSLVLRGYIESSFEKDGRYYFKIQINEDADKKRSITLPVTIELYQKYEEKIRETQKENPDQYVGISGELEIKIQEIAPF